MSRLLMVGDVFQLKPGMRVVNRDGWDITVGKRSVVMMLAARDPVVIDGITYRPEAKYVEVESRQPILGEYAVVSARLTGGGTAHGPHDVFPDGHEVTAELLSEGGETDRIVFFQTGCFTVMNPSVPVVRRMPDAWRLARLEGPESA